MTTRKTATSGGANKSTLKMLTSKESKLLALALDAGAFEGEWASAGLKFLQSLRDRKVNGFDVFNAKNTKPPEPEPFFSRDHLAWPGSIIMTFGKYKGQPLSKIEPGYFVWCLDNLDDDRNWPLKNAMQWLLDELREMRRK